MTIIRYEKIEVLSEKHSVGEDFFSVKFENLIIYDERRKGSLFEFDEAI